MRAGAGERLLVCCAFGPLPQHRASAPPGTCRWSGVAAVRRAAAAGATVRPWAGGGPEVPLAARLHRRTVAVAASATAGTAVLLHPRSRGALLLA